MSQAVKQALDGLKNLASVDEMWKLAQEGFAPAQPPKVNSHIHLPPNFSAFETVKQAVDLAAQQGVGVLCASNYYNFDVYAEFVEHTKKHNIFPLFGTEIISLIDELVKSGVKINDPGNPGKIYGCGKGIVKFAELSPQAAKLLETIKINDAERMAAMIEKLAVVFKTAGVDTQLDADKVIDMVVKRHGCVKENVTLQERHAAQAFQEAFFRIVLANERMEKLTAVFGVAPKSADDAVKVQGDIRSYLMKAGKSCFVQETFGSFETAIELVLELGGIPCYPTLADGVKPLCDYESPVKSLIGNLRKYNIHMAEFIPIRNTPEVLSEYVKAMRAAGIVVAGGTEHNTLDLIGIEPTCAGGAAVPQDIKDIFRESAYVIAAHQFLVLNGKCGYVDSMGNLNPDFCCSETRISAFVKLGAAVVEKYYQVNS